jgi:translocation and assembly module TamB
MKRALRRILIGLGAVVATVLVLTLGGYLYLQSAAGKRVLGEMLARALSSPGSTVTIEDLGGSVPLDMAASRITVSDPTGPWLEIDNVRMEIDGAALWHRELALRQMTASTLMVARLPEATPSTRSRTAIDFSLPELPVAVRIDRLAVDRVDLAEPVLGQPAALTFSGRAALEGNAATVQLDLVRTDDMKGQARLAMTLSGDPAVLDLKLDVSEPSGLLMARLLGRGEPQPLTVTLAGAGPLSSWQGKLDASVGTLLSLESGLALSQEVGLHLRLDGSATQQNLAPVSLQPLLGDRIAFTADLGVNGDVIALDHLSVTAAALDATASAKLDSATQAVTGKARLTLPDLQAAETLLGVALAGKGQLELEVKGSTAQPVVDAVLTGDGIDAEGVAVSHLDASLALEPDGPVDEPKTVWRIGAEGRFTGLTREGQPLPAGLGDAIDWSLAGSAAPAERIFGLDRLSAKGAGLDLAASGQIWPDAAAGKLSLKVEELAAFGGLLRLPRIHGRLSVDADLATDAEGRVSASLKGGTENFGAGIEVADAILGSAVSVEASGGRQPDGRITLTNLNIAAAAATLSGNAVYAPEGDTLSGRLVMRMPKLDPLAPAIRISIHGDGALTGDLGGSLEHPSMQALLESRNLDIEYLPPIGKLTAQISVADLTQPSGTISALFDLAGVPTKLDTGYAMPNDELINLRKLVVSAGGSRLAGNLDYDLQHDLAAGKLAGIFPDLQPWSPAAGIALAGSATTNINLLPQDGQAAAFDVTGSDVRIGTAEDAILLAQVKLQGKGRNLMNDPTGTAALDTAGITTGNLHIRRVHLDADIRSDSAIGFEGQAGGELKMARQGGEERLLPLALDLAGDWSEGKDGQSITLSRFAGKLGSDEAKLLQPATLALGTAETRLIGLDLDLAGGHLGGDAALSRDRATLKLDGKQLPLAVAGHLIGRSLSGALDFAADLDGTLAAPNGKITVSGRDIRITEPEGSAIPPVAFDLSLLPRAGQVALDGQASMPDARLLTVTGALPLDLAASSFADVIPANRPLALKLDGDGELRGFTELLALGEDRLSGHYTVALAIEGTRAEPKASGRLSLADGRYLNQAYGTELRSIAATLEGDQTQLKLTQFSAEDTQGGTLKATGGIDLAALPSPLLDLKAGLAGLRVVNIDTARVTASGDVGIAGSLTEPKLTANIKIPRAEFRIPDRLPRSVATLDVVVIDSRDPHSTAQRLAEARRRAAQPSLGPRVALDVAVTIPGQVFLRGRGLDSEWRGKVRLTGDDRRPEINGRLETVHGTMDLLGKSFVIRRGVITFPTGQITEPRMEVLAEYAAADITAQATLTGSPGSPNLVLSSTPQVPQDEILSRVLFGRDTSRITPAQGAQLALAANSLATGGPGILDRLRQAIGLDRLDVGSASTSPAALVSNNPNRPSNAPEDTGPTVSGGKYVAPGVFVGVEQGASAQSSRAKVEVDITRGLSAYSSVGTTSQVGLDWRLDY